MDEASGQGTSRTSLYEGSTQYRHWRFSPEQLADTRASLNTAAVAAVRDAFEADSVSEYGRLPPDTDLDMSTAWVLLAGVFPWCGRGKRSR